MDSFSEIGLAGAAYLLQTGAGAPSLLTLIMMATKTFLFQVVL